MHVPHNAFLLVADGRKMLFLRNEGDEQHLNLQVERKEIHANPQDREQKSDAAGRASLPGSGNGAPVAAGRGSMGEADYHQMEEDRFAAEVAAMLRRKALDNDYETLIVVAPPRTLGELRKHYHKEVEARLAGELAKDLTDHPLPQIEEALLRAE